MTSKNRTSNNYPMNTNTNTLNSKCAESSCFIYINVMQTGKFTIENFGQ